MENKIVQFKYKNQMLVFEISSEKDEVQKHIFNGNFYEQKFLEDLALYVPARSFVLDIGANIGNHSVFFTKILKANVMPFEPNPIARNLLINNIRLNKVDNQIIFDLINYAVGEKKSKLMKIDSENTLHNLGATRFTKNVTKKSDALFDCISLNDVKLDERPSLIKIDDEGMELDILRGANKFCEWHAPFIYLETSLPQRKEIYKWCKKNNYRIEKTHVVYPGMWNMLLAPV